jgi:RHS repeat-associated protein
LYDALGNVLTDTNQDGEWVYTYDADSQLTHAVFTPNSSDPDGLTAQNLQYVYDAAGNRESETVNGVTTTYVANNVNEYTSSTAGGVSTIYQYDADGNLIAQTTGSSTTSYTFNELNELTAVNGPGVSASYGYDPLGSRVSQTVNGATTHFQIDPAGVGNVVASLDNTGRVEAHDTYGLGLTSQVNVDGTFGYYDFNKTGSTIGITGSNGTYENRYSYLPFGETTLLVGALPNMFEYVGQAGAMNVESTSTAATLYAAGKRFLDATTGRFESRDPLGLGGGNNTYTYVGSDPASRVDPTGMFFGEEGAGWSWRVGNGCAIIGIVHGGPANFIGFTAGGFASEMALSVGVGIGFGLNRSLPTEWWLTRIPWQGYSWISPKLGWAVSVLPQVGIGSGFGYSKGSTYGFALGYGWGDGCPCHCPPNKPPVGPVTPSNTKATAAVTSQDPNSMTSPAGYGTANFVADTSTLPYQIDFENDPTATAPAQRVDVTDHLDPNLDWSTFQLTAVGFGSTYLIIPPGLQHYDTTVNLTENGQAFNVVISLNLDPSTGIFTTCFQSIDPTTNLPPASLLTGFLPPEDGTGRGIGFVSFTISPKAGLATGTQVRNVAGISFDHAPIISTDQVNDQDPTQGIDPNKQALVTIDSGPPASTVAPLPAVETSPSFTVSWFGQDDSGGSGVAFYDIYVSDNGGPFAPFLLRTTDTSATFTGQAAHTYGSYSVATDNVGNQEATPAGAEATTLVESAVPTATALTSDNPSGSVSGQAVTFTATVTPSDPSAGTPTGSVQFEIDGINFGAPVALNGGSASVSTQLAAGTYSITAVYSGDSNFASSTSAPLTQPVSQDSTSTIGTSSANPSYFGQALTLTATATANAPGSGTPTGSVDFYDMTTATDLGSVSLSGGGASLSTAMLPPGVQTITLSYSGDTNFLPSSSTVLVTVVPSIYVLNANESAALGLTGNASINIPGLVQVDSSSARALAANGNAQVQAGAIQVVGGILAQGQATLNPPPVTGAASEPDPLAGLPIPTGGVQQRSVNLTAGSLTIDPGIYFQIKVAGTGSLTLNPGLYVIIGGGFTVTQSGGVTGSGVMIYNTGSNYVGFGSIFGGITLTGEGAISLTPASAGPYAGVVIYQSRDNSHDLNLSAPAALALANSIVYAPAALLNVSGNAFLQNTLVVDRLHLGVAAGTSQTAESSASRQQVVEQILSASEYQSDVVNGLYSKFLHRSADQTGLNADTDLLSQGSTDEQIAAILAGPDEYFQKRGNGTDDGFLDALYQDAINRSVDVAGRSTWDQALANGTTRAAVAAQLFASTEYQQDLVQSLYQKYLARPAHSTGLGTLVNALQTGARDEDIITDVAASKEYFTRL